VQTDFEVDDYLVDMKTMQRAVWRFILKVRDDSHWTKVKLDL
jgi:hypothetical protein